MTVELKKMNLTCGFQQCGIFTSEDSNETVQPHFLSLETPNDVRSVA